MISEIEKRIECRMTGELCDKAVMGEISQTVLDRSVSAWVFQTKQVSLLYFMVYVRRLLLKHTADVTTRALSQKVLPRFSQILSLTTFSQNMKRNSKHTATVTMWEVRKGFIFYDV